MQLLNEEQRALLRGLSDAQRLASLSSVAVALFLIPRPAVNGFLDFPGVYNGTPYQGPSSFFSSLTLSFSMPVELALYLNLTSAQVDRIQSGMLAYQRFFSARYSRSIEVSTELEAEFGREVPTPRDLGDHYLEIESMRRQIAERETALRSEFTAILSPQQRTLTQALEQSQSRIQMAFSAQEYQLLPPTNRPRPASRATLGLLSLMSLISSRISIGLNFGLIPTQSIYRGCEGGPDFTYAFSFVDFGGLPAQSSSVRQ